MIQQGYKRYMKIVCLGLYVVETLQIPFNEDWPKSFSIPKPLATGLIYFLPGVFLNPVVFIK